MIELMWIIFYAVMFIVYFCSIGAIASKVERKKIETNILIFLLAFTPIVNTLVVLIYTCKHSNFKQSLKELFND
jgi:quinol-cytochrome oxidoreductase complex cytochrome b subunit